MRLIAFVMPITQRAVINGVRSEESTTVPARGIFSQNIVAPEEHEEHCREHLACHLGRGGDLTGIVEQPYAEDDRGAEHDTERFGGTLEDPVQVSDVVGDDYRDEEGEEHRGTAAVRDGMVVEAALVRFGDEGDASREAPERERSAGSCTPRRFLRQGHSHRSAARLALGSDHDRLRSWSSCS